MGNLNKPQEFIIKDFVNKRINSLPDNIRKFLFQKFYPKLNYSEFKSSDMWESLIFLEFQHLIEENVNLKPQNISKYDSKSLWGNSEPGPVG
jgi:hypothetical protein